MLGRNVNFFLMVVIRWVALVIIFILVFAMSAQSSSQVSDFLPAASPLPENTHECIAGQPSELLVAQGDLLRAEKQYSAALTCYGLALKLRPRDSMIWNSCGIANLQLGKYYAAKSNFRRALKYNKRLAAAHNNLGVVAYLLKDNKQSEQHYLKALELEPDSASFHSNLGSTYFSLRKYSEATREYARAIELDPEVFERTSLSGVAARLTSPEDRAQYSYVLAKLYAKTGDNERALRELKRASELGYEKLKDAYRDVEFTALRNDSRFAAVMGSPVSAGK